MNEWRGVGKESVGVVERVDSWAWRVQMYSIGNVDEWEGQTERGKDASAGNYE